MREMKMVQGSRFRVQRESVIGNRHLKMVLCALCALCGYTCGQGSQILQDGAAYAITSPYAAEDLFQVQYIQSASVMYMVHPDYHPQILRRYGDTNWTIEDVNMVRGPFMGQNETVASTITASATTGDITLTASADIFDAGHVGSMWQLVHSCEATVVAGAVRIADANSGEIEIGLNRDYTIEIKGQLVGTYLIERSYDDGASWGKVFNFEKPGQTSPDLLYIDKEIVDDAIYRIAYDLDARVAALPFRWGAYSMTAHAYERQGIVEITGVSTARMANATVKYLLGGTAATYKWSEGSFSNYRGFPAAVALHRERLVFGGTAAEPDTIWFSQTDDWHNFLVTNLDTSAITFTLAADQVNSIRWLVSHNDLLIGTSGDEWKLDTPAGKALSASTARRQSTYGSAEIQALAVNNNIIYAQRNAKKIQRMGYRYEGDNWSSTDLTLMSEHITGRGIVEMAYQRVPFSILWSVTKDGELLALVIEDNQEVLGWSRYTFDGYCESVAVTPGETEDRVWIIVRRYINGTYKRYVEQFQPIDFADQDSAFFVDCGLSFDGGPAVTVTNISRAYPCIVTAPEHTFEDGDNIRFSGVGGMDEVNYRVYTVSTVSGASFEMRDGADAVDINSVNFTAYTSGGRIERVENTFTTLDHLESKAVVAAGDGGYAGSYTVDANTATLDDYYNRVHIGLPYTAKLKPMKLDFLTTGGALQGRTKRITGTMVRLFESLSCSIGPTWTDYDSYVFRDTSDAMEAATPLFTGDKEMNFPGGFETAGDMCIQDSYPVPLTVLGIIVDYEVEK